jgi:hypothetical protein
VRYMKEYDFIVVNCGNHAAKMAEYSYTFFRASVNAMALRMSQSLNLKKIQFLWVENYAEPLRCAVFYIRLYIYIYVCVYIYIYVHYMFFSIILHSFVELQLEDRKMIRIANRTTDCFYLVILLSKL